MCGFVHVDSKCGHVLMLCFVHNLQFEFGCVIGQKKFFQ